MPKRLILNGFSMNAVSHVFHGFWRRPDTRQTEFNDLEAWIELARLLERGKFDALFVADILGVDASYKESWDTYLKEAVQVPINDSGVLAATLVAATNISVSPSRVPSCRSTLQLRQKGVDARPSEQRSGRLEHRDQRQPQRGAVGLKPD
jgi:hypothetical protein